ncbi:MAG: hypothetical protein M1823_003008 [Watsoniomyces obsoletus]|nr:MAG: hypothetical protein M1823_003008 [Watsoniomyces obsoletus]
MMMHQRATPPPGPQRGRGHPRTNSSGSGTIPGVSRGGIQKKRGPPPRVDSDGDLDMDAPDGTRARGRGGRGRARADITGVNPSGGRRAPTRGGGGTGLFVPGSVQQAIARMVATGEATVRPAASGLRSDNHSNARRGLDRNRMGQGHLDQISVIGLKQSKAASNPDGGVKDLLAFLERKATGTDPGHEAVRIKKSRLEGDAMIVSVRTEDAERILRLNTFQFAGTTLHITRYLDSGKKETAVTGPTPPSQAAQETRQRLMDALSRRYDPGLKLLNLSSLGKDPTLLEMGTFDSTSTTSKLFPALMVICDQRFTDAQQKRDAIQSVSLADNELRNISIVHTLAHTFPDLKNLDLSNNKLEHMSSLNGWRGKFRHLDHLVVTGNPIERMNPGYKDDLLRWYPSLRLLNGVQVRTDQEVAELVEARNKAARGKTALPIAPPVFDDEAQVAENFLKEFLMGFDGNREVLIERYYDEQSTFSFSINTSAPRALNQGGSGTGDQGGAGGGMQMQKWDAHIKRSRNLMRVNHLPARVSRSHTGPTSIRQCWAALPVTRHPNLFTEPHKWLIECHAVPGLPDPTRQFPAGVGGLMVMVHGEFDEMDVSTGQAIVKRSFDRTFVLGPGKGPSGIRVLSDLLTFRAYGGFEAWIPEVDHHLQSTTNMIPATAMMQQHQQQQSVPQILPTTTTAPMVNGMGLPTAPPTMPLPMPVPIPMAIPGSNEAMIIEMSKRTRMTLEYSKMCLDEVSYNFEAALAAFENVKGNLPAEAFMAL